MKHEGAVRRFGPRYGLRVKKRLSKIEAMKKAEKECPFCGYKAVKWLAVGIWYCKKCKRKFTGKAYTIVKKPKVIEKPSEEEQESKEVKAESNQAAQEAA
ncbi:hypothetical protein DRJ48_02350 [Candidatus Woesearchaeota archaeon]|nr:hypothetical protein [Candidatus Woesearchaeota archaeon]RLE42926.1 MAG: hypothetical protein DRJ48_02350 [Candidatus Woesearchaeota archaeon]